MNKIVKFYLSFIWFLRITIFFSIVLLVYYKDGQILLNSILVLLITFLPSILKNKYGQFLPIELEIGVLFLSYGSVFLGEFSRFYFLFAWWDLFLHTLSGFIAGFLAFFIFYKNKLLKNPLIVLLFSFSFSVACGGVWEIYEYGMDKNLGLNMQREGLVDTMEDLIAGGIGGILSSLLSYNYLIDKKTFLINGMIERFENKYL